MIKHALAVVISAALVTAIPLGIASAQTAPATQTAPAKPVAKPDAKAAAKPDAKPKKELTAQQQKMKDCSAKWQDEKKTKNVKGREAHRKFLSTCLKG